jgi:SAM-dependent methyltransferase
MTRADRVREPEDRKGGTPDPATEDDLGLGLLPGDPHYRAYVGPPADYDLVAAMSFNLLTTLGLRQHHALLDIGCGSLRVGRLLIPYLNPGRYVGVDPNGWLIEAGVAREVGEDQVRIKRPRFVIADSPAALDPEDRFDFALAQSVFSHAGADLVSGWLRGVRSRLAATGVLVATFVPGAEDHAPSGWTYPDCTCYRPATIQRLVADAGLHFHELAWKHPRQRWFLAAAPDFDSDWLEAGELTWNRALAAVWSD